MIKISISKLKEDGFINKLKVRGHADFAAHGKDIVCAAVSVLTYTLIESLDGLVKLTGEQYYFNIDQMGYVDLEIHRKKLTDKEASMVDLLTKSYELGLKNALEDYKKYAKITIEEV